MATDTSFITASFNAWLATQPWWKRYANTVTAVVTGAVVLATYIGMTWTDAPEWVIAVVGVVLFAGSVLGIRQTPNGFTPKLADQVIDRIDQVSAEKLMEFRKKIDP